jgi:hypothetical protein
MWGERPTVVPPSADSVQGTGRGVTGAVAVRQLPTRGEGAERSKRDGGHGRCAQDVRSQPYDLRAYCPSPTAIRCVGRGYDGRNADGLVVAVLHVPQVWSATAIARAHNPFI